jgi:hypothetical protein
LLLNFAKAQPTIAGETLSYFHQRVLEVRGLRTPVLVMGDFNDEPFDTSLVRHALSTRQRAKVTSARENPLLWNLMWPIAGAPDVSFYFDNQPNMLDQFMVNKNMATGDAPSKADPATARILKPPAMVNPGFYPNPVRRNGQAGQSERNPTISQSRSESPRSTRPAVTSPSVWLTWNYTRPRSPPDEGDRFYSFKISAACARA